MREWLWRYEFRTMLMMAVTTIAFEFVRIVQDDGIDFGYDNNNCNTPTLI